MKCKDVEKLLTLYHDGELSSKERSAFERHLAQCPDCQAKLAELEALDELVRDGEVERIPDPGHHYWSSFSLRVTRRLERTHAHLIRRPGRTRFFSWRLLPYLSAGVAVVLALVIVLPLIKQSPTKFTGKDLKQSENWGMQKDKPVPVTPPSSLETPSSPVTPSSRNTPSLASERASYFESADARDDFKKFDDAVWERDRSDQMEFDASMGRIGMSGTVAEEEAATVEEGIMGEKTAVAPSPSGGALTATESGGALREEKEATKQTTRIAPAVAQTEAPSSGRGSLDEETGEVFYVTNGIGVSTARTTTSAASEEAVSGTLKVVIDSLGKLANVRLEKSSGNQRLDSLAIARYKEENKNKTFRQRRTTLYVPFAADQADH